MDKEYLGTYLINDKLKRKRDNINSNSDLNENQDNDNEADNKSGGGDVSGEEESGEYEINTFCNKSFIIDSLFEGGQSVFFIQYDYESCKNIKDVTGRIKEITWKPKRQKFQLHYKAYKNLPDCIKIPFKVNGAIRTRSFNKANLIWKLFKYDKLTFLLPRLNKYQRYNHFPCTWDLGRKDNMNHNYLIFKKSFNDDYNYVPETFIFPRDRERFLEIINEEKVTNPNQKWILKPCASSRGRGIRLISNFEYLPYKCLISRYIDNPHIINNRKYDLRLYVVITSFTPLKIYLYNEGLVRFASEEYNPEDKNKHNKYMHLTNYSINKCSQNFNKNMSVSDECVGSKWSISAYKKYFKDNNLNYPELETKIKDIIIKSVITIADKTIDTCKKLCKYPNNLFELYGFDVLVDRNLKPWLVEVNLNASLNCDSDLDKKIKTSLLSDIFTLVGLAPYSHLNDNKQPRPGQDKRIPKTIDDRSSHMLKEQKENENQNNNNEIHSNSLGLKLTSTNTLKSLSYGQVNGKSNSEAGNSSLLSQEILISKTIEHTINKNNFDIEESEIIIYSEDEFARTGQFERVFPLKENFENYIKFIQNPEKENITLWRWLKNSNDEYLNNGLGVKRKLNYKNC